MNTEAIVKHLRVLWRTDRIIADIRMRHLLVGLGLRAFAALIAAFGLLMLELPISHWSRSGAPFPPQPFLARSTSRLPLFCS